VWVLKKKRRGNCERVGGQSTNNRWKSTYGDIRALGDFVVGRLFELEFVVFITAVITRARAVGSGGRVASRAAVPRAQKGLKE
jgi:hypothetical protein